MSPKRNPLLASIIIFAVISISIVWYFATTDYPTHSDVFWLGVQSGFLASLLLTCLGLIGFLSYQLTRKVERK